jgi:hypothetical protein
MRVALEYSVIHLTHLPCTTTSQMYRMGKDRVRRPFGVYKGGVAFTPYVHSFSVTERKI